MNNLEEHHHTHTGFYRGLLVSYEEAKTEETMRSILKNHFEVFNERWSDFAKQVARDFGVPFRTEWDYTTALNELSSSLWRKKITTTNLVDALKQNEQQIKQEEEEEEEEQQQQGEETEGEGETIQTRASIVTQQNNSTELSGLPFASDKELHLQMQQIEDVLQEGSLAILDNPSSIRLLSLPTTSSTNGSSSTNDSDPTISSVAAMAAVAAAATRAHDAHENAMNVEVHDQGHSVIDAVGSVVGGETRGRKDIPPSPSDGSSRITTPGTPTAPIEERIHPSPSSTPRRTFSWEDRFSALQRYKEEHQNVLVPRTYTGSNGADHNLGEWVGRQRQAKKKGKLLEERITKLESIGFEWEVERSEESRKKRHRQTWNDRLTALKNFKEKHGHLRVPIRWSGKNCGEYNLGAWASNVRQRNREGTAQFKLSKIPTQKKVQLDALGFIWAVEPAAVKWEDRVAMLKLFKLDHGHLRVPRDWSGEREGEQKLGAWVHHQRVKYKKDNVEQKRKADLDSIGFVWEVRRGRKRKSDSTTMISQPPNSIPRVNRSDNNNNNNDNNNDNKSPGSEGLEVVSQLTGINNFLNQHGFPKDSAVGPIYPGLTTTTNTEAGDVSTPPPPPSHKQEPEMRSTTTTTTTTTIVDNTARDIQSTIATGETILEALSSTRGVGVVPPLLPGTPGVGGATIQSMSPVVVDGGSMGSHPSLSNISASEIHTPDLALLTSADVSGPQ